MQRIRRMLRGETTTRSNLTPVGAALSPLGADITWILDVGFDDVARWGDIWE